MSGKIVVCRCEDVTLKDLHRAIEQGYDDIEALKRYTGFGTGPCQGKECMALVAASLLERTGQSPDTVEPFTSRPPLTMMPLKHLVADEAACYPLRSDPGAGERGEGSDG